MLSKLKSLFSDGGHKPPSFTPPKATFETVLAPEQPFCAVGDMHGCLTLIEPLYEKLRGEFGDIPIVFLGDHVDRGPDSAGVLRALFDLSVESPTSHISIIGNHEKMMLEFIDDPAGMGARWLSFGGQETLESFGITLPSRRPDAEDALEAADKLEGAMPKGMLNWLRALPPRWSSGNVHCVHAAMDPEVSPEDQDPRVMINGHPDFFATPREDGQTVVHGHTVVSRATAADGRISIDTGAYYTGRLTAAYIAPNTCRFIE